MSMCRRPVYYIEVIQAIATLQVLGANSSRNSIINEVIKSRRLSGRDVPNHLPGKIHQVVYYGLLQGILKQSRQGNMHLAVGTRYLSSLCQSSRLVPFAKAFNCKGKGKLKKARKTKPAAAKATAAACKAAGSKATASPKPAAFWKPAAAAKSADAEVNKNPRKRIVEKNTPEIRRKNPHV